MAKPYVLKDNFYKPSNDSDERNIIKCYAPHIDAIKQLVGKRIHGLNEGHPELLFFTTDIVDHSDDPVIIDGVDDLGNKKCRVYTNNVMGFLDVKKEGKQLLQLKITSRFAQDDGDDYFLQYMLCRVMGINVFSDISFSSSNGIKAFDFLMLMLPSQLKAAYAQGLFREYQTFRHNDANVRGVIDVSRHIRQNMPFQGKVAYNTREYTRDNPLMQLIRHTIECIESRKYGRDILRSDQEVRAAVDAIRQYTPRYSPTDRVQVIADNLRPVMHPYYTAYSRLQELCLRILRHEKIAYGTGKDMINGILFDGAWLWEEYMAVVLREQFDHFTQKTAFNLFKKPEEKYFQKIIPDYLSKGWTDGDKASADAVADAKYMRLEDRLKLQGEQAYSVYYKTIMYMHRFNSKKGFIFYPMETLSEKEEHKIENLSIAGTDSVMHLAGFRIPKVVGNYAEFKKQMAKAEVDFCKTIDEFLKKS